MQRKRMMALGAILVLVPAMAAAFEEAYLPLDHWAYPILERFQVRGGVQTVDLSCRPITRGDGVRATREIRRAHDDGRIRLSETELGQLGLLEREFAPEMFTPPGPRYHVRHWLAQDLALEWTFGIEAGHHALPDTAPGGPWVGPGEKRASDLSPETQHSTLLRLRPEATLRYGSHAILQERLDYRFRFGDDLGRGHVNIAAGEAEFVHGGDDWVGVQRTTHTLVRAILGPVGLELGRAPIRWGPGRDGTLLVSDFAPPMDFVRFVASAGRFRFTNLAAELRSTAPEADKWLAAHRVAYVAPSFSIGLSEAVIFGGRAFDLAYLNPFQLFYIVEANIGDRDNNLVGVDARWTPHPGWEIYGELVADDSNIRDGWNYFGNKNAFQLGVEKTGLPGLADSDLRIEWSLVDEFTYTHHIAINRASHYERPIGHRIGTDADLVTVTLRRWVGPRFELHGSYEQERHGEGDITRDHDARETDRRHFLLGVVERTRRAGFGLSFRSVRGIEFQGDVRREWIRDYENRPRMPSVVQDRAELRFGMTF